MSSTSNNAVIHGENISGTQIGQIYGSLHIDQRSFADGQGGHSKNDECLQLFRLSKEGGGGNYEWYKDRIEDRVQGTCEWFLSHPNYLSWKQSSSGPLLVSADPGCGKSVLAKHLIEHELPGTVCYFFFKDRDQNTARQALCALLHQLFVQRRSLLDYAIKNYDENGKELLNNEKLLWEIFSSAVHDSEAGLVTIVLDALDECRLSHLKALIRAFRKLLSSTGKHGANLKLFFTVRPYQNVLSEFWELAEDFPNIRIPGEEHSKLISREVNCVIKYRAQQLARKFRLKSELREYLQRRLLDMTHRTYLWTYLVFDHLDNGFKKTEKAIKETIDTLPHNVNEAYEKILEKSSDMDKARLTLSIVLAASRPMTLADMNVAVHVLSTPYPQNVRDLDLEDEQDFKHTIRDWCGLFISVYESEVYFIHQTAREFLLARSSSAGSSADNQNWRGSIQDAKAHAILTESCLRCINFLEFKEPVTQSMLTQIDSMEPSELSFTGCPFFRYAATYWPQHYRKGHGEHQPALALLAVQACASDPFFVPVWFYLYYGTFLDSRMRYEGPPVSKWSSIHIACAIRLEDVAERLFSDAGFEGADVDGNPLLFYAVDYDLKQLAAHLVGKGANIDYKDQSGQSALARAIRWEKSDIASWLLEHGADSNGVDEFGEPLLHSAVRVSGEILNSLLAAKADAEARDSQGQTALHVAAALGKKENMNDLLFNSGLHLSNLQDHKGRTSLHVAAFHGQWNAVRTLITNEANVEARDQDGSTPLFHAVYFGWLDIIEQLLEAGADANVRNNNGDSILELAALKGNRRTIVYAIHRGARVDTEMVARLESSGRCKPDILQLLRDAIQPSTKATEQEDESTAMDLG